MEPEKVTALVKPSTADDGFCIDDFTDIASADFEVKHPVTEAPSGIIMQLAGPEHPLRKKMQFARVRKMRNATAKAGMLKLPDPADEEDYETDFLAACILGWNKMPTATGNVAYSPQAARDLMADPKRRWLRNQVKAGVEEREAFIAG